MRYFGPMTSESKMKIPALLLFVVISGCCCAKENLHGASFVFYKSSDTSRVVLKPNITEPLVNITVCLQCYTDNARRDSLFKLVFNSMPQFRLFQTSEYYFININGDEATYKTSKESMEWRLICVSWESGTGVIHFVVNGKLFPRRVLKPGFIINPEVTAVLGENIVVSGRYYDRRQTSFLGEIKKVNMWDRALHPSEMESMYYNNCYYCNGTVIRWDSVDYEVYGDVILYKPSMKP